MEVRPLSFPMWLQATSTIEADTSEYFSEAVNIIWVPTVHQDETTYI